MTSTNRLTLYVNPMWRRGGIHTPLLYPWWGNPYPKESIFAKQMFDAYSFDTEYYTVTDDIQKADMVLPPYPHVWFLRHDIVLFDECVQTARKAGLPLLIDGLGDVETPIVIENAYILRYGGDHFMSEHRKIQIPPMTDDLLERHKGGRLSIRKKRNGTPIVGFAGWAKLSPAQYLRTVIKELPMRLHGIFDSRYRACMKGVLWRQKAIGILQHSPSVTVNLHVRGFFSGSPKTAIGDMQKLRDEMVETILESDYALDVRGDANDSTKFFEILSLGRIPVIVNTERNFPFSDKIDYSSFSLTVDFRDIKHLPERIAEFHKNVSPEAFEQMQRNARDAFVNYFRIDALMRPIVEELRSKLSSQGLIILKPVI